MHSKSHHLRVDGHGVTSQYTAPQKISLCEPKFLQILYSLKYVVLRTIHNFFRTDLQIYTSACSVRLYSLLRTQRFLHVVCLCVLVCVCVRARRTSHLSSLSCKSIVLKHLTSVTSVLYLFLIVHFAGN